MIRLEQQMPTHPISASNSPNSSSSIDHLVSRIESLLITDPTIADCAVLASESELSQPSFIAYIVPGDGFSAARSQSRLTDLLPDTPQSLTYVPVATLPLTTEGQIDQDALRLIPVLDEAIAQHWEQHLNAQLPIAPIAVTIEDYVVPRSPWHLSDLIPQWQTDEIIEPVALQITAASPGQSDIKVPAIVQGTPLEILSGTPLTLPETLKKASITFPTHGLTYIQPDGSTIVQSYGELIEKAERILAGLRQQGLKPQDKVIFQLEQNQDFMAALWGCLLGGFIPIPVSIAPSYTELNATVSKLNNAWQSFDQPLILTSQTLAPALQGVAEWLHLDGWQVAIIDELQAQAPDSHWHPSQPDDLALLLLTSGSTGMPKGVMLNHHNVISRAIGTAHLNGFSSEEITLNWMPLDHVAGLLLFHVRDVYLGCQQIHAPITLVLQSPLQWFDWMEQYRVTVSFAPNFAYGLVNEQAANLRQWDLSSVRCILNGGEAIAARTARQFLTLMIPCGLAPAVMRPAWGMSETSSGVTYSDRFSLDSTQDDDPFVEVGSPIPGFSIRIVDSHGQVVDEGEVGQLQVQGAAVTLGYYQNSRANTEAFTEDGWFVTGDLAYLRHGQLTIAGREKDVIIINGANYYSHEIEAVVETIAGIEVSYTAACAVRGESDPSDRLAIFFHTDLTPSALLPLLQDIRQTVVRHIGINPTYLIPVAKEAIPKTAIGKIQRSQLKQEFESGEFAPILKQLDLWSENANTLPNWFYQKTWQRHAVRPSSPCSPSQPCRSLIFQHSASRSLVQSLQPPDAVIVEPGRTFEQQAADRYQIDPHNPAHYQQLMAAIAPVEQIFHLWTYGESELRDATDLAEGLAASQSVLYLIQAIAHVQEQPTRLTVISSQTQQVTPTDPIAPPRAIILGMLKTAAQELAWLDCRHIDLPPTETIAAHAIEGREREVAYRQGQRWIPRLTPVEFQPDTLHDLPFQSGKLYLISGGLGGIGVKLAQYLQQHYQAKLLLLGRTALPPQDTWADLPAGTTAERVQAYQTLQASGCDCRYAAVDVGESDCLSALVRQVEADWQCQLQGVIHLAGTYQEQTLLQETAESFATTLRPKVWGTWALHQLITDRPGSLFIHFSSLTSFFGGALIGAYAAANAFLDTFTHYQRQQGIQSYCFSWSLWNETGMSRGTPAKEALRARGYQPMTAAQGLNSLIVGLRQETAHLLVGLNPHNRHVRRYSDRPPYPLQQLTLYSSTPMPSEIGLPLLHDRQPTPIDYRWQWLPELPLTHAGTIDRQRLLHPQTGEKIAPRTALEQQITAIWQDILNVPDLSIQDNFFELGGSSILAVRLLSRLEQTCHIELSPTSLLTSPTIAQLAEQIASAQTQTLPSSPLLLLKSGSEARPPLFFIPGGGAVDVDFLMYAPLLQALSPEQRVYGLEARRRDAKGDRYTRLEDMAADYTQDIRAIQPQGPYLLSGECVGGILGVEIARCLKAQGEEVALVALLDSGVPLKDTYRRYQWQKRRRNLYRWLDHHRRQWVQTGLWKTPSYLMNRLSKKLQNRSALPKTVPPLQTTDLETAQTQMLQMRPQYDANEKEYRAALIFRHSVQPYPGQLTLLINEARYHEHYSQKAGPEWTNHQYPNDPSLGWSRIAPDGVTLHVLPGNHDTYIREEVQSAARVLDTCIVEAIARSSSAVLSPNPHV